MKRIRYTLMVLALAGTTLGFANLAHGQTSPPAKGDFNGDLLGDFISRDPTNGNIYLFLATPSRSFLFLGVSVDWDSSYDVYYADVNGDGKADLVTRGRLASPGDHGNVYVL